eukprot:gnl/MRDRNA2_/MRDRNA2_154429_c0_seq1.p1 gnl/MRDRNA2_/MRDRNA2_154429_c0~~gnl/MRDRNA2_/MRDRNA2_154429_c0_seq1.p1  ORF type:complete len:295 (+),score=62.44 gnl/MRDRNA2_/MRDRNA2_154429_c0_seq1:192-1076(+)
MKSPTASLQCCLCVLYGVFGDSRHTQHIKFETEARPVLEQMARWIAPGTASVPTNGSSAQLTPEIGAAPLAKETHVSEAQRTPDASKAGATMAASEDERFSEGVARWPAPGRAPILAPEDAAVVTPSASHQARIYRSTDMTRPKVKAHNSQIEVSVDPAALEGQRVGGTPKDINERDFLKQLEPDFGAAAFDKAALLAETVKTQTRKMPSHLEQDADPVAAIVHHAHSLPKSQVPIKSHLNFVPIRAAVEDGNGPNEGRKLRDRSARPPIKVHQQPQADKQEAQAITPKLMRRA